MKIYFTASARGKNLYGESYKKIFYLIEKLGHKNLDDLVLKIDPKEFYLGDQRDRENLYNRAMIKIRNADMVVLEVSIPSLSMGFVMEKSLARGKPVVALYSDGLNPYFADGIRDKRLQVLPYTLGDISDTLKFAIEEAEELMESRFTMILSPEEKKYLDKIAKTGKTRSEYIRDLIAKDMKAREK